VRGFSEALRKELQGTSVGVSVVHPGGVATSIARSARRSHSVPEADVAAAIATIEAKLKMPPADAGETIVRGIERRKPRIIVGNDAKFISLIERAAPVSYWNLLERMR
jgi:short-subunit dehydrogenase